MKTEIKFRKAFDINNYSNCLTIYLTASITHHNEGLNSLVASIDEVKQFIKDNITTIQKHFPNCKKEYNDTWCYIMHDKINLQVSMTEVDISRFNIDYEGMEKSEYLGEKKKRIFGRANKAIFQNLFNENDWEIW